MIKVVKACGLFLWLVWGYFSCAVLTDTNDSMTQPNISNLSKLKKKEKTGRESFSLSSSTLNTRWHRTLTPRTNRILLIHWSRGGCGDGTGQAGDGPNRRWPNRQLVRPAMPKPATVKPATSKDYELNTVIFYFVYFIGLGLSLGL